MDEVNNVVDAGAKTNGDNVDKPKEDDLMEEEEVVINYTSDEAFNELCDQDETTEVAGYIDEIHAPKIVGNKTKYDLFKFVINNGSQKRIVCLVWGKPLINKYEGSVIHKTIIRVDGATTKATASNFYKETNKLVPFELLIRYTTTVQFFGIHKDPTLDLDAVPKVDLSEIGKSEGFVSVEGNIKMKFVKTKNKNKLDYYGCGSMTDGESKIIIHIMNYTDLNIEKGVRVRIIGEIDKEASLATVVCRDENGVIVIPGAPKMSAEQLSKGVKTPKRARQ